MTVTVENFFDWLDQNINAFARLHIFANEQAGQPPAAELPAVENQGDETVLMVLCKMSELSPSWHSCTPLCRLGVSGCGCLAFTCTSGLGAGGWANVK